MKSSLLFQKSSFTLFALAILTAVTNCCPVGFYVPLDILNRHLNVHQNELLRGVFSFNGNNLRSNQSLQLHQYETIYEDYYSKSRINAIGHPDTTLKIEIRNLSLRVITSQSDAQSQEIHSKDSQKRDADFVIFYEKVVLEIKIDQEPTLKAILKDVKLVVGDQTYKAFGQSRDKLEYIVEGLNEQLVNRLYAMQNWGAQQWLDVLPFGSQLLGGIGYHGLSRSQITLWKPHAFTICTPPLDSADHSSKQKKDLENEMSQNYTQLRISLYQDSMNKYIQQLHSSENIHDIPLAKSEVDTALEMLKGEFQPFQDADSFTLSWFLNEQVFDQHWGEDNYEKTQLKMTKDGNITLFQNVGLYIHTYDADSNLLNTLTVLIQFNAKIQVQDQKRFTRSRNEKRLSLKIHQLFTDQVEVYDDSGELLEKESMVVIVALKRGIKMLVTTYEDSLTKLLHSQNLDSSLGDMFLESSRDQIGFNWIRFYVQGKDKHSVTLVGDFDQEDHILDPSRYEASNKYGFKWHVNQVKEYTAKDTKVFGDNECQASNLFIFEPFFNQWCLEELELQKLADEEAYDRCMRAWCELLTRHLAQQFISSYHLSEFQGVVYLTRWCAIILFQIVAAIGVTAYLYTSKKKSNTKDEKKKPLNK